MLNIFIENVCSPVILFFILGILSGFLKSDLKIPDQLSKFLSLYLMMAIGFKGGVAISQAKEFDIKMINLISFSVIVGFFQPFIAYFLLKKTTKLDKLTMAAISAHYGSVSMVTFLTTINFLDEHSIAYAGYVIAIVAIMETPAIISALLIVNHEKGSLSEVLKSKEVNIFKNGVLFLLIGSLVIGIISGTNGMEKMKGFLVNPFQGILALFLLDMGLSVSRHASHLKEFNIRVIAFGIYMPFIGAGIGLLISKIIHLDLGTATLFTTLCASSSYIAATIAMKNSLPEAKAGIYLPLSLAITFPFNISIGIPLYFFLTKLVLL